MSGQLCHLQPRYPWLDCGPRNPRRPLYRPSPRRENDLRQDRDKGLALDYSQGLIPQLIIVPADDPRVLIHDATLQDPTLHRMLAMMGQEGDTTLPVALGVIRNVEAESYDAAVNQQICEVRDKSKAKTFDQLTATLEQWEI